MFHSELEINYFGLAWLFIKPNMYSLHIEQQFDRSNTN